MPEKEDKPGIWLPNYCIHCQTIFPAPIKIGGQRIRITGGQTPCLSCGKNTPLTNGNFSYIKEHHVLLIDSVNFRPEHWPEIVHILAPYHGKDLKKDDIRKLDRELEKKTGKKGILRKTKKWLRSSKPHEYLLATAAIIGAGVAAHQYIGGIPTDVVEEQTQLVRHRESDGNQSNPGNPANADK